MSVGTMLKNSRLMPHSAQIGVYLVHAVPADGGLGKLIFRLSLVQHVYIIEIQFCSMISLFITILVPTLSSGKFYALFFLHEYFILFIMAL
jgi:hypothetical protein